MHILMLSDVYFPRVNGVSTSIQTFAREFSELGHTITLIAPKYHYEPPSEFEVIRIPSKRLPFDPEDRLMSLREIKRLMPHLKTEDIDIIHIQTPFVAHYAGVYLGRALDVRVVLTYHTFFEAYFEKYLPRLPKSWLRSVARRFSRKQCDQADAVVSPSRQMPDRLREYGVTQRTATIPTGLLPESFRTPTPNDFRERHSLPEQAYVLLYVGRVAHEKNIELLISMFTHVLRVTDHAILLIAGEGPALEGLRIRARKTGKGQYIRFIGYLDRAKELLEFHTRHGQVSPAIARPLRPVAALRFLAIERLLRVIAPGHETNMTHTFS